MLSVSVIIPTHNRCSYLKNTLDSIINQENPVEMFEIIVVDNNSKDNTPQLVSEFMKESPNIRYIKETEIGLHNARHAGARAASGEILVYVDDDVLCCPDWLSELIKPYSNPDIACVGGKILPKWEVEPPEWINEYNSYLSLLDLGEETKELHKPLVYGCNFSIRKELLFEFGGFNPDAFGKRELIWYRGDGEIGLLKKVLISGKKIIHNPKAIVYHVIPEERTKIEYLKHRSFIEGISSSFTQFRDEKYGLVKKLYLFLLYGFLSLILSFAGHLRRQQNYFIIASGYKSRSIYQWKLIFNQNLKKSVLKTSWL